MSVAGLALLLTALTSTGLAVAPQEPVVEILRPDGVETTLRWPDAEGLEPAVIRALQDTRTRLEALPSSSPPPEKAATLGDAALLLLAHEFWESADDVLASAEVFAPDDFRWSYYRAWGASRSGELERALELFETTLEKKRDHLPSLVRGARVALELADLERGRQFLAQALELAPDQPAVLAAMGQLALELGHWERAIELLERALDREPEANALYYPLALAYRRAGDIAAAGSAMARRGEVGIDVPDPLLDRLEGASAGATAAALRGRSAFAAGRYEDAVLEFERALAADPERLDVRINLGAALGEAGELDRAIAEYDEVLSRESDHAVALLNLSQLLVLRGDPSDLDRLTSTSRRAAERLPEDVEAQRLAARVARRSGDLDTALAFSRRAVALEPFDEPSRYEAALLLLGGERFVEASELLEESVALMPSQGRLLHLLARLLAAAPDPALRDGARAVAYAEDVARQQPAPDHLRTLALAYAEAGRCEDAVEVIERLMAGLEPEVPTDLVELQDHLLTRRPCRMPLP